MGTRYLLDTNVVVKYLQKRYPLVVLDRLTVIMEQEILISFVTHIELLCYNPVNSNPETVAYKQNASKFAYHSAYIGINNDIVLETIRIRKTVKTKLPDSIIAATAIIYDFTLLSDNDSDFQKIAPLGLIYESPETWC